MVVEYTELVQFLSGAMHDRTISCLIGSGREWDTARNGKKSKQYALSTKSLVPIPYRGKGSVCMHSGEPDRIIARGDRGRIFHFISSIKCFDA